MYRYPKKLFLIGGGGYIGSRFLVQAMSENMDYDEVILYDLDIYGKLGNLRSNRVTIHQTDVARVNPAVFAGHDVVYFAGFHKEPEDLKGYELEHWEHAYRQSLVTLPSRVCEGTMKKYDGRFIYCSSMRVLTEPEERPSLYAECKCRGEAAIEQHAGCSVRFGTVWGGFAKGLPNRTVTAINQALIRGNFTGNHYKAFTTHIEIAINGLVDLLDRRVFRNVASSIVNFTDGELPTTAAHVRLLLENRHHDTEMQGRFNAERNSLKGLALEDETSGFRNLQAWYGIERISHDKD